MSGASFEYAYPRASARLAARPDERQWQHLHATRQLAALLDSIRASPAAFMVAGIDSRASLDAIELGFRQQWRLRVAEAVRWVPDRWSAAVLWVQHLVDLPALVYLAADQKPLAWMTADPVVALYRQPSHLESLTASVSDPAAALRAALAAAARADAPAPDGPVHPALAQWERQWRQQWPACGAEVRGNLESLLHLLHGHMRRFGALPVAEASTSRQALTAQLTRHMHRAAAEPAAVFAWLAILAIDLERLRGECLARALEETGAL